MTERGKEYHSRPDCGRSVIHWDVEEVSWPEEVISDARNVSEKLCKSCFGKNVCKNCSGKLIEMAQRA